MFFYKVERERVTCKNKYRNSAVNFVNKLFLLISITRIMLTHINLLIIWIAEDSKLYDSNEVFKGHDPERGRRDGKASSFVFAYTFYLQNYSCSSKQFNIKQFSFALELHR